VLVHNGGTAPTSGTVFVTDFLPPGLTASIASGPGWACNTQPICSRSDALPAGGSYPLITVTVSVAPFASSQVSNQVTVSGGGSATATASDPTTILPAFTDVMPSDSFLPAIDLLKEFGITSGCSAQPPLYCETSNITEAQMAVFIVRSVIGGDNFTYTQTPYFSDVPASYLYFPWIQKMQDLGIAVSCGVNQFCPETPVTRGIMAVLIIRGRYGTSIPTSYPTTAYFTDVTPAYPFFPWIQKMKEQGITTGCTPTTYCPDTPVTRGQMAVFIIRGMFNLLLPSPVISSGLTFGAGQYLIGKDIPAGRYYTVPAVAGGCYWERLSGLGGSLGEIIANDFIEAGFAQAIVDIAASDLAFSTNANCGTWYNTPRLGAQSSIPSGTWLVGAQIAPGTYQASAQSGCYWERLRDFSGSLSAIITNDFVSSAGNQLVSIAASDVGFSSTAECGVWTRVSSQLLSSQSAESPAEVKNRNWLMKRSKGVRIQTPLGER
ncbi:MAG TPA: S-layer homology domain-containing protein, partial [Bryobacteraceae bacterium]|nr:S-layer homology domain-containing protein [Bryobacteraceae bacterium]